jgi:hypothetical protein
MGMILTPGYLFGRGRRYKFMEELSVMQGLSDLKLFRIFCRSLSENMHVS